MKKLATGFVGSILKICKLLYVAVVKKLLLVRLLKLDARSFVPKDVSISIEVHDLKDLNMFLKKRIQLLLRRDISHGIKEKMETISLNGRERMRVLMQNTNGLKGKWGSLANVNIAALQKVKYFSGLTKVESIFANYQIGNACA